MASPSVFNQFYTWLAAAWLDWAGLVGLPPGYFVVVWDCCVICNSLWLFIVFLAMGWRWWGKTRPADVVRFVQLWRCNGQKANKESLLHYNSKNRFFSSSSSFSKATAVYIFWFDVQLQFNLIIIIFFFYRLDERFVQKGDHKINAPPQLLLKSTLSM